MSKLSNLGHALYEGKVSIDFVGRKWLWYSISGRHRAAGVATGCCGKGLNLGIEFEGGVEYRVSMQSGQATQANVEKIRDAVADGADTDIAGRRVADRQHLRLGQHPGPDRAARPTTRPPRSRRRSGTR